MARVRASCQRCGDVELTSREVQVDVCSTTSASSYSFQCPKCGIRVSRVTTDKVVGVLTGAGVQVRHWTLPQPESPVGPPITHDDLLAFHYLLADDDGIAQILEQAWR